MNGARLLIAEDDEALAALLEEYLSENGYDITLCHRGDDALEKINQEHFDIVLTDIVMPGADGLTVLAAANKDPITTLVVLMTGYSGIEDALHAVEQGAYDFVSKPFQLPEIRVRLNNATRYQALLRRFQSLSGDSELDSTSDVFIPLQMQGMVNNPSDVVAMRAYARRGGR
ncbi:MAG: response regulator [Mariprofundaceae bacterium]|nr:response regulator [Mariprofundaceae bacterium]